MNDFIALKGKLHKCCIDYVNNRLHNIQTAMASLSESANDETKSSVGDKHETGRTMAQLEQEKLSYQLMDVQKQQMILNSRSFELITHKIKTGSLVLTNNGNYYLSISAGKVCIDKQDYFAVSVESPIGMALVEATNSFSFNGKEYRILKVG